MNHPQLDKAREWATVSLQNDPGEGSYWESLRSAAELIQSLPDEIIDAEKVRALIASLNAWTEEADADRSHGRALGYRIAAENLAALLPAPPLPTLADMTPEERERCQWMQADVKLANGGSTTCVIANPRTPGAKVRVWAPHGGSDDVEEGRVTPLPDLPKLEWPGSTPDDVAYATGGALTTQDVVDECRAVRKERTLPRPEDVPAGEAWLALSEGRRAIGYRNDPGTRIPWVLVYRCGMDFDYCYDSDITLVSRLVPEVGA